GAPGVLRGARGRAVDPAPGSVRADGGAPTMTEPAAPPEDLSAETPPAAAPVAPHRAVTMAAIAVSLAIVIVFPLVVTDPTATSIAVFTLVFMVSATAWNIFCGYSGYLALGHAVFFGCGGYAVALAARDWHVTGGWAVFGLLPFGGIVAGLIAIPVGLVAL